MRAERLLIAGLVILGAAMTARAKEKDAKAEFKKEHLYGTWKVVKGLPAGATGTMTLTKDGKVSVTFKIKGKEIKITGTYKMKGDKVTMTTKVDGKEKTETETITKLTATEFVTKDEKGMETKLEKLKKKD
jgi:uncharacterized protein (TIGR03066 family)